MHLWVVVLLSLVAVDVIACKASIHACNSAFTRLAVRVTTSGAFTSQDVPRPAMWQDAAMPRACTGCMSHVGSQEQALRAVSSEIAWLNTLRSHFAIHCSCCMHFASRFAWRYLVVAEQHQCICIVICHSAHSSADGSIILLDGLPLTARAAFTPSTVGAVAKSISAQNNYENLVSRAVSPETHSQPEGELMLSQLGMLPRIILLCSANSVMQHS